MTADLEAVTRTLAEEMWADFREMYPGVECTLDMAKYEEPWVQGERHTILALAARLAPVLVSLPDDRLAEAAQNVKGRMQVALLSDDYSPREAERVAMLAFVITEDVLKRSAAATPRAALSGGDAP